MEEKCENCKFWQTKESILEGWCRRYPEYVGRKPDDYCGEFTPKIKVELLKD
jgi:hypothetical protein